MTPLWIPPGQTSSAYDVLASTAAINLAPDDTLLDTAGGREEPQLLLLLSFINRHVQDAQYARPMIQLMDRVLNFYAAEVSQLGAPFAACEYRLKSCSYIHRAQRESGISRAKWLQVLLSPFGLRRWLGRKPFAPNSRAQGQR